MNIKKLNIAAVISTGLAATVLPIAVAAPAQATPADYFIACPSGHSGVATTVTSCAFAENVRYSYLGQYGQVITAYSPVTGMYYNMQCAPGFIAHLNYGPTVPSVRCVGGNNAVVIVF